ncbi:MULTISPECIES: DsrE family protein [Acetobacter]|uniref:Putative peroxiredoxin n=1 Tax=Acetobacter lovaniensis TaxID=104100 RepID=A0A841QCU4_9PROT|nr:DsrE family protein [Acetobacter lovaniensis]MBB6456063.1 putative peroxiredoxin [Acetobacter lovaniensis]MCI1697007.1 DsrE/DsrF/DrsH-like family protein [Acetobacter lovaniensis]MCI1795158.1 DsrE/DsrF/DrsH-like family protein [Acetobacter lovaniensis]MCP1238107.1 DsrE/DsrF/DrsH-like family protein [Acetobacter lovaniensis]
MAEAHTPPCDLALLVVEARYERIHAAYMLAATAAAMGQNVLLFGMGAGVCAFCGEWNGLDGAEGARMRAHAGVAGLDDLREAVVDMGVTLMVCDSGVKTQGLNAQDLLEGVETVGLPSFFDRAGQARQLVF